MSIPEVGTFETPLAGRRLPGATGQPTIVETVEELLVMMGSVTALLTVAVFETLPVVPPPSWNLALSEMVCPAVMVLRAQGKLVQPPPVTDTKVMPDGVGSLSMTFEAGEGPLFVTRIV